MICEVCHKGAELNGKWRQAIKEEPRPHNTQHYLLLADEAHGLCRGCDCQHATGVDSLLVLPL